MGSNDINIILKLKDQFSRQAQAVKNGISNIGREAQDAAKKSQDFSKGLETIGRAGKTMVGIGGAIAATLGLAGGAALKAAGEWQQLEVTYQTLIGDIPKANKVLKDLKNTAAKTPFELSDLAKGGQTLLAFGIAAEDLIPTITTLGDIAGGNKERFQSLSLAFGQMSSSGRLMGQDLLQMINAGFNPLQVISQKTGKSVAALKKEMEKGAISVEMVKDAFKTATAEGGQFYNLMQKQSQTLEGRTSTMRDGFAELARTIGKDLLPIANRVVDFVINLTNSLMEMPEWLRKTIVAVGAMAAGIGALMVVFGGFLAILPAVIAGMTALGLTFSVALWWITGIVAGITALVAAYTALRGAMAPLAEKTDKLVEKHDKLREKANNLTDQLKMLEEQGKKNGSQYLKLQKELDKTNEKLSANEKKIRANIKALQDEKKEIEAKIRAQKKEVAETDEGRKEKELKKLEALEEQKRAIIAASEDAKTALLAEKEQERNETLDNMSAERKAFREELEAADIEKMIADQEAKMAMKEQWFQQELARVKTNEEAKTALEAKYGRVRYANEQKLTELKAKQYEEQAKGFKTWLDFMAGAQKSQSKELAAIGKAIAIYNITMDTYRAATGAYAALAGIPFVGPALGAAAAAAAIAWGMEQANKVQSSSPGFQGGGVIGGVSGASMGEDDTTVRARKGEVILNASQQERFLNLASGEGGGEGDLVLPIYIDGVEVANAVVKGYNRGRSLNLVGKITEE